MYYKEDNLAKRADSLQLKCSAASGEITICAVGVESCGDLISGSPPTGNRTGREPENQEVLSNSGKQIEVSKTEEAGQRTGNQSILVCWDFWARGRVYHYKNKQWWKRAGDSIRFSARQTSLPSASHVNSSNWQELPLQCHANLVPAGAVWSQRWILPWADTRLLTLDAELCIYYYFALLRACISRAATELPSLTSLAGGKRHWAWTGNRYLSISWCWSLF